MKIRSATLEYQGQVFTFTSKPVFGATGAWVLEDVAGWFGGVGVRAETTDRLGHGMFQQRAWRSNRALTLAATYIANDPDERLALQRALSGMLWAGDYGTLTVETDRVLSCPVRLDGEPGIVELGTHGVQLQVPLVSMDPWLYGEGRETLQQPQGSGVGLVFPPFKATSADGSEPADIARTENLDSLTYVLGTGNVTAGGGATVSADTSWADTGTTSLKVSAGTSTSSAAYVGLQNTSASQLSGCYVEATAKIRLEAAQADNPASSTSVVPRSLNILARPTAGSSTGTHYGYMFSNQAPNTAGVHEVTARFLAPDDADVYQQWLVRLINGSTTTPVWWDSVSITGMRVPRAVVSGEAVRLAIPPTRVMQGLERDWATGDWYVTQRSDEVSEDLWVQRLTAAGEHIETMHLPGGGHGGDIAIQRVGDQVWWWGDWEAAPSRRVRVRFREGTVTPTDPDVEVINSTNAYVRYSIFDGKVCERVSELVDGVSHARYRLFTIEDYLAGATTPLKDMTLPNPTVYAFQGFIATDQYIYENGGGTRKDPTAVYRYDWATGEQKILRTSGEAVDASGYDEAEGITIDPVSGELVVGKASGAAGARIASAFRVTPDQFDYTPAYVAAMVDGPLDFGSAVNYGDTITNYGNATAYPTHVITGDFPGGVSLMQNKGTITFPWPLTKLTPLRIEASGSAWIGDTNVTARLTARDFNKFAIEPGGVASPRLTALQGGEGHLSSIVRDTFI